MTTTLDRDETQTHEAFIHAVRAIVAPRIPDAETRARILTTKLVYGAGNGGVRGVTYYGAWTNGHPGHFLEVCASAEEGPVQLCGTTIHEIAHALTGPGHGHGAEWKAACRVLGLLRADAAGQRYDTAHFAPDVWAAVSALDPPADGTPTFTATLGSGAGLPFTPRPCRMGIGARGGKSRGPGSGSRLRLWVCACTPPVRVRVASDAFEATCNRCRSAFARG